MIEKTNVATFFEDLQLENKQYKDLIFEFVTKNNLQAKFHDFLQESFEVEEFGWIDLKHLALDYKGYGDEIKK